MEVHSLQRDKCILDVTRHVAHFDDIPCLLCDKWRPLKGCDTNSSSRKLQCQTENHLRETAREALPLATDGLGIREYLNDDEDNDNDDKDDDDADASEEPDDSGSQWL